MMSDLADYLPQAQVYLWAHWLVFLRIAAVVGTLPAFGEQSVPVRVRLGIAAGFTLIVAPSVPATGLTAPDLAQFVTTGLPEILTGLLFGLMLRFFVFALQIAGSIAAQSTSLSQIFGGSAGADAQPAIGHVLVVAGLALATLMGLHVQFATYMIHSYDLVPQGALIGPGIVLDMGVAAVGKVFALGFTLAAPFVIGSLLYNVTLGVINRAMPQLMVSFVGAPAITAGGLFLFFVTAPLMLAIWLEAFAAFVTNPAGGF